MPGGPLLSAHASHDHLEGGHTPSVGTRSAPTRHLERGAETYADGPRALANGPPSPAPPRTTPILDALYMCQIYLELVTPFGSSCRHGRSVGEGSIPAIEYPANISIRIYRSSWVRWCGFLCTAAGVSQNNYRMK